MNKVNKEVLEVDISSFVNKAKTTKKDIIKYADHYHSLKLSARMTRDKMLDSILKKRKQQQEKTALYEQRLRSGTVTYDFPDLLLSPGPVLLPLEYGILILTFALGY